MTEQKWYCVRIECPKRGRSFLVHRGTTIWRKRTAMKHLRDIQAAAWFKEGGCTAYVEVS